MGLEPTYSPRGRGYPGRFSSRLPHAAICLPSPTWPRMDGGAADALTGLAGYPVRLAHGRLLSMPVTWAFRRRLLRATHSLLWAGEHRRVSRGKRLSRSPRTKVPGSASGLERAAGIEPASPAWKAGASPLGQARNSCRPLSRSAPDSVGELNRAGTGG